MLKKIWDTLTSPFKWVKRQWDKLELWVAKWAPGLKTKLISGLGFVGSSAALLQEFLTGVPLSQFVTATTALMITTVLFALAFWFRRLSNVA